MSEASNAVLLVKIENLRKELRIARRWTCVGWGLAFFLCLVVLALSIFPFIYFFSGAC